MSENLRWVIIQTRLLALEFTSKMATDEKTSKFAHNAERSRAWFDVEEDKEPSWTEKHLMPIIENISNKEGWLVMAVLTLFCVIFYWLLIKYKGVFDWRAFPGWRG